MPTMTQGVTFAPSAIGASLDDGFQARLHDPLWLLARQWQFGEFQAEDTGSAARVRIESEQAPITRYRAGNGAPADFYVAEAPLETLVEREEIGVPAARPLALTAGAG